MQRCVDKEEEYIEGNKSQIKSSGIFPKQFKINYWIQCYKRAMKRLLKN